MANILVVDDDSDSRSIITFVLQKALHQVTGVANGKEALAAILTSLPDVVLLDLAMPEMDGPSFLEVVRSYLRLQSLPVVVLTGLIESPMIERTRSLKVNTILIKGKATNEDIVEALESAVVRMPG